MTRQLLGGDVLLDEQLDDVVRHDPRSRQEATRHQVGAR